MEETFSVGVEMNQFVVGSGQGALSPRRCVAHELLEQMPALSISVRG
jgi:hypothetical protein